ncbi:MAG: NrfD/PsrC family molybdoenzyme membrane anchor subunit [Gemmatimonadota bacterium]
MTLALTLSGPQWTVNPGAGVPHAPGWGWYVILYFFLGGLAGGCFAIAAALDLRRNPAPRDRDVTRLGYLLSFPGVIGCGVLLLLDLGRPPRFWHLFIASERPPVPIFKYWSPISFGAWTLTGFGLFAFVAFVRVLIESGRLRWSPALRAADAVRRLPRTVAVIWTVIGILFALALAGYTGVLMIGTAHPVWHNAIPLGGLFLASSASTSYALLIILLLRRGYGHRDPMVRRLSEADRWAIALECLLLALVLVPLGGLARPLITGAFGALFWIGVVLAGLLLPLLLDRLRAGADPGRRDRIRAGLVLAGGLLLRFVFIMAPQWPEVRPWHL